MHLRKRTVVVLPHSRHKELRGYIGEIEQTHGHEVTVRFRVKINNQIETARLSLRDIRAV